MLGFKLNIGKRQRVARCSNTQPPAHSEHAL